MKIILSPSKTQNMSKTNRTEKASLIFDDLTNTLFSHVKSLSKETLAKALNIKGKLLEDTFKLYQSKEQDSLGLKAIQCYKGVVFEQMKIEQYNRFQLQYLNDKVVVLSAMYGLLKPSTIMWPYRLDMTCKLQNISLYSYWRNAIDDYLDKEDYIINLASNEFSTMIVKNKDKLITLHFREEQKDKTLKTISYNVKKARGNMAHQLILSQTTNPIDIQKIIVDGYQYDERISNDKNYYFIKRIE